MNLDDVTPLILTYDEAPNIRRTLEPLDWAKEIIVVDSGSTDGTLDILSEYANVRVVQREFDTFAEQCNFGLEQIATPWVLSLDADYFLPEEFREEIRSLDPRSRICGYRTEFKYCVFGRALRGSLYPPRTILYRREVAKYRNEGHGHRVQIEGDVLPLKTAILHDDRKPMGRWLDSQRGYAKREAEHLQSVDPTALRFADRIRHRIVPAPPAVFFYTLLVKRCLLDGWPGYWYVLQRTYAEILLSLELLDRRLRAKFAGESPNQEQMETRKNDFR